MSQLRNLFQKSAGRRHELAPTSVETGPEDLVKPAEIQEIPVVEAHLTVTSRVVCHSDSGGPAADRFRYLRMRLREQASARKLKRLLVTSSVAQEGKSTIVVNLATVLAERGKCSVLLVEGDLHRPSLAQHLGLPGWGGLSDCLNGYTNPISVIRRVEPLGWYLLPGGSPCDHPTELLQKPALSDVIQNVSRYFDWILVDSPPVLPLTDALSLRQQTDGSLLVVRAAHTGDSSVEEAIALVGKQHVVGLVLNGVDGLDKVYSKYGYYYHRNGHAAQPEKIE